MALVYRGAENYATLRWLSKSESGLFGASSILFILAFFGEGERFITATRAFALHFYRSFKKRTFGDSDGDGVNIAGDLGTVPQFDAVLGVDITYNGPLR